MLDRDTEKPVKRTLRSKSSSTVEKPEEKAVNLQIKNVEAKGNVGKQIPMHELLKAQKKIDKNNLEAGIVKEPLSRPRSKQHLPIANK